MPGELERTVLTNVRVFDGHRLLPPDTLVLDGAVIGTDPSGARRIDGHGAAVLPGLIDAHVHLSGRASLEALADSGVTTALDMGTPWAVVDPLRHLAGTTDIRSAGNPAVAPGSLHARIPGSPPEAELSGPGDAAAFVERWVAAGADYIKVIVSRPGLDQATLDALVVAAHRAEKLTVAHASSSDDFAMVQQAGFDVITHCPLDRPLDAAAAQAMVDARRISVPTLTMMEGIVEQSGRLDASYAAARESVGALHRAGVPILAGTDANDAEGVPANIAHGASLHRELELLLDAGLSNVDALRAATVLPARHFGLADRGAVRPGMRADLVLVDGDPLGNITATRHLRRVWCAGIGRDPEQAHR